MVREAFSASGSSGLREGMEWPKGPVENPHHSALEYSLERGGSNDISRVVSYGVCYLLLISIVSLVIHVDNHSKKVGTIGKKRLVIQGIFRTTTDDGQTVRTVRTVRATICMRVEILFWGVPFASKAAQQRQKALC